MVMPDAARRSRRPTRREALRTLGGAASVGLSGCLAGRDLDLDPTRSPRPGGQRTPVNTVDADFRFTSFPDFFNWDIPYPQPNWESALSWFLDLMKAEGPAFSLVAGDIMDARWWHNRKQVRHYANLYWGGWLRRLEDHGIQVFVAPGDHERGDNPWPESKLQLVPAFEDKFRSIFRMPRNGPPDKRGLAYFFERGNALFITVDTFQQRSGRMDVHVSDDQLAWLERTLSAHRDKTFIVVQGHVPVTADVATRSSTGLVLNGRRDSGFWQLLQRFDVDAYLCGEHHDITVSKLDGIWHVVHGAIWGTMSPVNYLVGHVGTDRLTLELKEFSLEYGGGRLWQRNRTGGPRQTISIPESVRENGPELVRRVDIPA